MPAVDPRDVTARYQTAARIWLTAAVMALALPERFRLGIWLPLHLALAGAVTTAISGAMQNFALALTASPDPPARLVRAQFWAVTFGAGSIAIGIPSHSSWLVAVGGALLVSGVATLGWIVLLARRRSLHRRHRVSLNAYTAAVTAFLVGGTLGALLGAGAIPSVAYARVRLAHLCLNVLGWGSLTVVGTLITLLPTTLRIRIPAWHGAWCLSFLIAGVVGLAVGTSTALDPLVAIGGLLWAGGAALVGLLAASAMRTERKWRVPGAAMHLIAGVGWFVLSSVWLAVACWTGGAGLEGFRPILVLGFVGGWLLQVLLGAWSYLLPMARPGHPDERRRELAALELGAIVQVAALNVGLALAVAGTHGWIAATPADVGRWLVLAAGVAALAKAWTFPWLALLPFTSRRAADVWG